MAYGDEPGMDPMPSPKQLAEHKADCRDALKIGCRNCGAKPDTPCINRLTGRALRKEIVHSVRITDAKTIIPLPVNTPADSEELF